MFNPRYEQVNTENNQSDISEVEVIAISENNNLATKFIEQWPEEAPLPEQKLSVREIIKSDLMHYDQPFTQLEVTDTLEVEKNLVPLRVRNMPTLTNNKEDKTIGVTMLIASDPNSLQNLKWDAENAPANSLKMLVIYDRPYNNYMDQKADNKLAEDFCKQFNIYGPLIIYDEKDIPEAFKFAAKLGTANRQGKTPPISSIFSQDEIEKFTGERPDNVNFPTANQQREYEQQLAEKYLDWRRSEQTKIFNLKNQVFSVLQAEYRRLLSNPNADLAADAEKYRRENEVKFSGEDEEDEDVSLDNSFANTDKARVKSLIKVYSACSSIINEYSDEDLSFNDYQDAMKSCLKREITDNKALDKYADNFCMKFLIKLGNVVWGLSLVPPLIKLCFTGSGFFSSVGKTEEAVEEALRITKNAK